MKHRILAAVFCVCLALTSLCMPAFADDTEPASVEETPAPVEATPAPVEEASVPSVQANWNDPKINDEFLEAGT